jgi:SM-20-related protein
MLRIMYTAVQPLQASNDPPRLNPGLNRAALADEFRAHGRINIADVLTRASCDRLHHCLRDEIHYRLCTIIGGRVRSLENLSPEERHTCSIAAWREVGIRGFQFLYDMHLISSAGEPYADSRHYFAQLVRFLNGPEFLGFAREITGIVNFEFADAQATLYRSGHFLTAHDDDVPKTKRVLAYVLGFTPVWRPEWGGLLEFVNRTGHVDAGFLPGLNTLKLFRVPMSHYVSVVAPYAQAGRYSITGWLRAR